MSYPTPTVAGDQLPAADFNDFSLNPVYTYGETLAVGDAVYLKAADGKIWKADADVQAQVDAFVGIVAAAGNADDTKRIFAPGKVATGLSSLTAGSTYYLSNTAGGLSLTAGTFSYIVGVAISTTALLVAPNNQRGSLNDFGNGSDGELALDGTNTYASILSKAGATYTALRDIFATNIVFSGSAILVTAGYKIFANGTVSGTGTIRNNGTVGSAGTNGTGSDTNAGGAAGTSAPGVTVPSPAAPGAGGQSSYSGPSNPGVAGGAVTFEYFTTAGSAGGAGGGAGSPGAGGAGGSEGSQIAWRPFSINQANQWFSFSGASLIVMQVAPGAGGGGGGGEGTNVGGGGGGGGGGAGGFVFCAFANIIGSITFEAKGAAGGNGGTDAGANSGGGGGGGGGNGGIVLVIYRYSSGYTTDVTSGAYGAGGTGTNPGSNGVVGSAGIAIALQIK
ncbi:MAG: hypothetical protein WC764_04350 [Candidatus Paceibacterota bacterium]|jgi:hypothetical protein